MRSILRSIQPTVQLSSNSNQMKTVVLFAQQNYSTRERQKRLQENIFFIVTITIFLNFRTWFEAFCCWIIGAYVQPVMQHCFIVLYGRFMGCS